MVQKIRGEKVTLGFSFSISNVCLLTIKEFTFIALDCKDILCNHAASAVKLCTPQSSILSTIMTQHLSLYEQVFRHPCSEKYLAITCLLAILS